MEIKLENVGIVREASVVCDGLTVITGKNNSGKTTISRALYAIVQANNDLGQQFEKSKRDYLGNCIRQICHLNLFRILSLYRENSDKRRISVQALIDHNLSVIQKLIAINSYFYVLRKLELDNLIDLINEIRVFFLNTDYESFKAEFPENTRNPLDYDEHLYNDLRNQVVETCDEAMKWISAEDMELKFLKLRIKQSLMNEFHNQVKPVATPDVRTVIEIYDGDTLIEGITITDTIHFSENGSYDLPLDRGIFIDNPFVIDALSESAEMYRIERYASSNDFESSIQISSHNKSLSVMLSTPLNQNFFDRMAYDYKTTDAYSELNKVLPGEFKKNYEDDGFYYIDKANLRIENMATGSKQFSILKLLLQNGYLTNKTIMILDEPESHLHPEWINKYSEIIVMLVKEIGVRVVLTTHSSNLMLALDVFSKKHGIKNITHHYLAEEGNDGTVMRNIDDDLAIAYSHLSMPFLEMNLENEYLNQENANE